MINFETLGLLHSQHDSSMNDYFISIAMILWSFQIMTRWDLNKRLLSIYQIFKENMIDWICISFSRKIVMLLHFYHNLAIRKLQLKRFYKTYTGSICLVLDCLSNSRDIVSFSMFYSYEITWTDWNFQSLISKLSFFLI